MKHPKIFSKKENEFKIDFSITVVYFLIQEKILQKIIIVCFKNKKCLICKFLLVSAYGRVGKMEIMSKAPLSGSRGTRRPQPGYGWADLMLGDGYAKADR